MNNRKHINDELKAQGIRLPAEIPLTPYKVPAGYFDELPEWLLRRIRAEETASVAAETVLLSATISSLPVSHPYTVPEGYFDALPGLVWNRIQSGDTEVAVPEELETLSPLLHRLKKDSTGAQGPYRVPAGYFEAEKKTTAPARVLSLSRPKWFRLAAAAVITGILLFAGWQFVGPGRNPQAGSLARFEQKLNKELNKMTDTDLRAFLQYADANGTLTPEEPVSTSATEEIKSLLKDIPEAELELFLAETSDNFGETDKPEIN